MSTKIRLARGGAKRRPYYRIVVADSRMPRDGRYIEKVGTYNPMLPKDHEDRLKIDADKIKDWLGKGAQPTDRVARLISAQGVMDAPAVPEQTKKDKPGQKALERIQEKADKAAAAAEAAEEAAAE